MNDAVIDASRLDHDLTLEADVAIVGTGAGGATAAAILARAGQSVVMLEEGGYYTRADFRMREAEAYPSLYQELGARKTKDNAISILQGRCVGGTTVVNWTSSFRIPEQTLAVWREQFGLSGYTETELAPWYEQTAQALNIGPWEIPPNPNNAALKRGAERLGWSVHGLKRNVKACANLGYCGVGCPIDAKQSMLVTRVPEALAHGARLIHHARAERFEWRGDTVAALHVSALDDTRTIHNGRRIQVRARRFIAAGGAINTPALLLRSDLPDPHGRIGRRTFLHPSVYSAALMPERIEGWAGAPQSVYVDEFIWKHGVAGPMGYKIEVPPLQPVLALTGLLNFGADHAAMAAQLPHVHVQIVILRDGFHPDSPGGRVELDVHGRGVLDYPLNDYLFDGVRRAWLSMAELQFAAGARQVFVGHAHATAYDSWPQAQRGIQGLRLAPYDVRISSAHVMGGCGMGADPRQSVTDPHGRFHHLGNLFVLDGSLFPTSLGINPQWTIYALSSRLISDWLVPESRPRLGPLP
jgi:choline dehydrogenase-like flavoprotein